MIFWVSNYSIDAAQNYTLLSYFLLFSTGCEWVNKSSKVFFFILTMLCPCPPPPPPPRLQSGTFCIFQKFPGMQTRSLASNLNATSFGRATRNLIHFTLIPVLSKFLLESILKKSLLPGHQFDFDGFSPQDGMKVLGFFFSRRFHFYIPLILGGELLYWIYLFLTVTYYHRNLIKQTSVNPSAISTPSYQIYFKSPGHLIQDAN